MSNTTQNPGIGPAKKRKQVAHLIVGENRCDHLAQSSDLKMKLYENTNDKLYVNLVIKSEYFVLDMKRLKLVRVLREEFKNRDGRIYVKGKVKLKICNGLNAISERTFLKEFLLLDKCILFNSESLPGTSTLFNMYEGLRFIGKTLTTLGNISQGDISLKGYTHKFALNLSSLVLSLIDILDSGAAYIRIINTLISFASLLITGWDCLSQWMSEGVEDACFSVIEGILPKGAVNCLRKLSVLTNVKIFDNCNLMYKFFSYIVKFLKYVFQTVPSKLGFTFDTQWLDRFLDGIYVKTIVDIREMLVEYERNKKLVLECDFRRRVKEKHELLEKRYELEEWKKKSPTITAVCKDFNKLYKIVEAYENSNRIEPVCIVFEGPPGTLKSVCMNYVISVMNETAYAHSSKSMCDGKEWWDAYNQQTITYMDDVGQKGLDQWNQVINLVSPVKCPLDCAEASLKDTKFFTSELIMLTTNKFMNIRGLCKNDGISDVTALWRRGYVFSFNNVERKGNVLVGLVEFKYFCMKKQSFIGEFPIEFLKKALVMNYDIPPVCDASSLNLLTEWMVTIIQVFRALKHDQQNENVLNDEDLNRIRRLERFRIALPNVDDVYWPPSVDQMFGDNFESTYGSENVDYARSCEIDTDYDFDDVIPVATAEPYESEAGKENDSGRKETYISLMKEFLIDNGVMLVPTSKTVKNVLLGTCVTGIISGVFAVLVKSMMDKNWKAQGQKEEQMLKEVLVKYNAPKDNFHPLVTKLQKNMYDCDVFSQGKIVKIICVISGHTVILPSHACYKDEAYLTIYQDRETNHRLLDNIKMKLQVRDCECDVALWELPKNYPTTFKSLKECFKSNDKEEIATHLVHAKGIVPLQAINCKINGGCISYNITTPGGKLNTIPQGSLLYELHSKGMCGSLVVSNTGRVLGMHVAGSDEEGLGAAIMFSKELREKCRVQLQKIGGLILNSNIQEKVIPDSSAIKLEENLQIYTPKNTNLIPSELFGVFEVSRQPADLSCFGPHTVKDIAKMSRVPINCVSEDELNFGKQVLDLIVPYYKDITIKEVILGNDKLAGMNKKSSNGICEFNSKYDCFDFEKGEMKKDFEEKYNDFYEKLVIKKEVNCRDIAWFETLKDELKPSEKLTPRSFRVSNVYTQVLAKQVFGDLVQQIMMYRDFNEIMIGVNPFKHWNAIYDKLKIYKVWAGDIGKYDKKMLAQVQQAVTEVLVEKCLGNKEAAECILMGHAYSVVAVNDDVYVTTHSMPSGSYLTAMLNSLVNRFYKAMWYYRNVKNAKPSNFYKDVGDLVYGDDTVNYLKNSSLEGQLNAITMCSFFESIGMEFTTSTKTKINNKFEKLSDITFLKRSFVYHSKLKTIVGPLDLRTIYSSLSWVDSKTDMQLVIRDKINAFQREMFLHEYLFEECVEKLSEACKERNVVCVLLPEDYLISLYATGEYDPDYNHKFFIFE